MLMFSFLSMVDLDRRVHGVRSPLACGCRSHHWLAQYSTVLFGSLMAIISRDCRKIFQSYFPLPPYTTTIIVVICYYYSLKVSANNNSHEVPSLLSCSFECPCCDDGICCTRTNCYLRGTYVPPKMWRIQNETI